MRRELRILHILRIAADLALPRPQCYFVCYEGIFAADHRTRVSSQLRGDYELTGRLIRGPIQVASGRAHSVTVAVWISQYLDPSKVYAGKFFNP